MDSDVSRLREHLRGARKILIFTGAGISTASGIPDYRGPTGRWTQERPVYYQEFMSSDAARRKYWDYKVRSWAAVGQAQPNAVHNAIVRLEKAGKLLLLLTQNVDGLHRRAGTSPERLVEIHGTDWLVECQSCGWRSESQPFLERFRETGEPPVCSCGGFLKPATISFGQDLRTDSLALAEKAARECDLVVALGSTLAVQPAASFPLLAASRGTPYIIINRGATDHDNHPSVSLRMAGDVTELFPRACETEPHSARSSSGH